MERSSINIIIMLLLVNICLMFTSCSSSNTELTAVVEEIYSDGTVLVSSSTNGLGVKRTGTLTVPDDISIEDIDVGDKVVYSSDLTVVSIIKRVENSTA